MGELIKNIGKLNTKNKQLDVELNGSDSEYEKEIHIQNSDFRFCFYEREFWEMAAAVIEANRQLRWIKKGER